jgi:micrococcal nuclease
MGVRSPESFWTGKNVNREQVRRGYAWVYRQYSSDPVLLRLEGEARQAKTGLWSDEAPVPPWQWRKAAS